MRHLPNSEDPDEMLRHASSGSTQFAKTKQPSEYEIQFYLNIITCDPLIYIMDNPILIVCICMGKSIRILYDVLVTIKAAPHECVIRTGQL